MTLAVVTVLSACSSEPGVSPTEQRAHELNKAIMCPVCPGESIDQSQNPLAIQMRGIVAEKLQQGDSEAEIKAFFVERYGPSVLLEPPTEGFSLAVWIIPPIAVVAAVAALYLVLKSMRRPQVAQGRASSGTVQLTEEERARYFQRIETALDGDTTASSQVTNQEQPRIESRKEQMDGRSRADCSDNCPVDGGLRGYRVVCGNGEKDT